MIILSVLGVLAVQSSPPLFADRRHGFRTTPPPPPRVGPPAWRGRTGPAAGRPPTGPARRGSAKAAPARRGRAGRGRGRRRPGPRPPGRPHAGLALTPRRRGRTPAPRSLARVAGRRPAPR